MTPKEIETLTKLAKENKALKDLLRKHAERRNQFPPRDGVSVLDITIRQFLRMVKDPMLAESTSDLMDCVKIAEHIKQYVDAALRQYLSRKK